MSLKTIKVGKRADKTALDFVYNVRQDELPATVRQVIFIHNGRGFTFSCTASEMLFGATDTTLFDPLPIRVGSAQDIHEVGPG